MNINLQNIEELIFYNQKVRKLLPDFKNQFGQWDLSRYSPSLRSLGKKSLLDVLNNMEYEHLKVLESYFKEPITLMKLDYQIVRNNEFDLEDAETQLNELDEWIGEIAIYRDADHLYISNWR